MTLQTISLKIHINNILKKTLISILLCIYTCIYKLGFYVTWAQWAFILKKPSLKKPSLKVLEYNIYCKNCIKHRSTLREKNTEM